MPGEVTAALALSKVLGLSKPDGGVRPIAVPSLLRLAGKALCHAWKDSLSAILGRQQFAVGLAAGTETLTHSVRALVEADPELVLLALDAQNAFRSASREKGLCLAAIAAPDLTGCTGGFCRRASKYFFWAGDGTCHVLFATDGFDQGDPPSQLFFALGFRPHLQQLEETLRRIASEQGIDPNRVRVLAYADDVTVLVPASLASAATTAAAVAFRNFGLQLRADKTQAWSRQAPWALKSSGEQPASHSWVSRWAILCLLQDSRRQRQPLSRHWS